MIYLLEDDEAIRELVEYSLSSMGMKVRGFPLPSLFRAALEAELPELVLLDIMLPEEDGFSILRFLKSEERLRSIPVIMLTARDSEFDTVAALDCGADDFVTKPFRVMELVARTKAVLRRSASSGEDSGEELREGGLVVCPEKHLVTADGAEVALTYKEFELLLLLMRNRGVVLTRDRILSSVWGYEFDGENRTVDVHVRTLRAKLGECGGILETVRGVGYRVRKG